MEKAVELWPAIASFDVARGCTAGVYEADRHTTRRHTQSTRHKNILLQYWIHTITIQHLCSTLGKPFLTRPLGTTTAAGLCTAGYATRRLAAASQDPLHAAHESAQGAAGGGGDGVNEDDLAVFDAKVVGIRSARELGQHLDGADGFVDDVAADVGVRDAGGGGAAGGEGAFGLGGLADHQGAVELLWESTLIE